MKTKLCFLLYSETTDLDWRSQEKYRELGESLQENGFTVDTVTWSGTNLDHIQKILSGYQIVLVWVNPIHREIENGRFEAMLVDLIKSGVYVSADPRVIEAIGTKKVLVRLAGTSWVSHAIEHSTLLSLQGMEARLSECGTLVTKQFRGNDGLAVYKLEKGSNGIFRATEANTGTIIENSNFPNLLEKLYSETSAKNPTIEVSWNKHLSNGIVRCYFCHDKLVGFGYQEINALYPLDVPKHVKKQRFYLTSECGIFLDLRKQVEGDFIPQLLERTDQSSNLLPILWDADFFIVDIREGKYELCEINASCVSPFPTSAIEPITKELVKRFI